MYPYSLSPIDYDWEFLPTVDEVAARYGAHDAKLDLAVAEYEPRKLPGFLRDFASAKEFAADAGWEGDFRGEAHVLYFPGDNEFEHGFVWKQDNNGTTFVVSPKELPYLGLYR